MKKILYDPIPLFLAVILSVMHFFSHCFSRPVNRFHVPIVSFSAGFFISLIFLQLFPEIINPSLGKGVLFFLLSGFVLFHILEKYLYQHVKNKHILLKDLKALHVGGFFIDHFVIGLLLILAYQSRVTLGFFVFLPLALHTVSSSMALDAIHLQSKGYLTKIVLSLSTTIGAFVAIGLVGWVLAYHLLLAFCVGIVLYVVIRDMLPQRAAGSVPFFILGLLLNLVMLTLIGV